LDAETETLIPTIGGVFDVAQPIAFQSVDHGADASVDLSPTIRRHDPMAVAQPIPFDTTQITSPQNGCNPQPGAPCHPLAAGAHIPAIAQPYSIMPMNSGKDYKARETDIAQPIMAGGPVGGNQGGDFLVQSMAVRRLTPIECERLQGFPDNYTNIKNPTPDGPRYKALGNSMAVPVMRWIGERINAITSLSN